MQVRQLLFPGVLNGKKPEQQLETERVFKVCSKLICCLICCVPWDLGLGQLPDSSTSPRRTKRHSCSRTV